MAPFWLKGGGGSSDDAMDDLSAAMHVSRGRGLLRGLAPDDAPAATAGAAMPKVQSMLEMNVIHDMVQFGEAMDALSDEPPKNDQEEDDDGGFFIGAGDDDVQEALRDGAGRPGGGKLSRLSSSPDSVMNVPGEDAPRAGGGMRRVMSQMTLTSAERHSGLSALTAMMNQDIHTISEEGDNNDGQQCPKKSIANSSALEGKTRDRDPPSLEGSSESSNSSTAPESAPSLSLRRPSRRSSAGSGMPLKSSLKGSSNNLRSSLKSNGSLDVSNHSSVSGNGMKRNVSFSSLEIRSYSVTLGDAPTSCGPAVSLDWEYDPSLTAQYDIDMYETFRTDEAPRRNKHEMLMPPNHRQYLLMREAGFSRGEIRAAVEEARRVARQRAKTVKRVQMGLQPVDEVMEKTRRKFGKLAINGKKR